MNSTFSSFQPLLLAGPGEDSKAGTDNLLPVPLAVGISLTQLCDKIAEAAQNNARSINNTIHAGISHAAINDALEAVRSEIPLYHWDDTAGKWLIYTLLLAIPFPAKVVRSDPARPVWMRYYNTTTVPLARQFRA